MGKLTGKVALVTGASRGIGAAIALKLASEGAAVAVNYAKSPKAAEEVVAKITAAGGKAAALGADVSDEQQVKKLFKDLAQRHKHLDIVVNNAGVWGMMPAGEGKFAEYRKLYDLNVGAPILVVAEAVKLFPDSGGRIINITSVAARAVMPGNGPYGGTKAALEAITRNWAAELGPRKITVNAVAPGITETEMVAGAPEEFKKGLISQTPLGRLGLPEDIAEAVAFLASEDARWITGQVLDSSGGLR